MGSDESHFYVSLTVRDKVTRPRLQTTIFEADTNRGPPACQPNALPLGQTGSHGREQADMACIVGYASHCISRRLKALGGRELLLRRVARTSKLVQVFIWLTFKLGLTLALL